MGAEESTLGGDEGGDEVSILVNTVPGDARDGSTAPPPSSGETGGKEKGKKGKGKGKGKKPKTKKAGAALSEEDKDKLSRAFNDSQRRRKTSSEITPPSPGYGGKPGGPKWRYAYIYIFFFLLKFIYIIIYLYITRHKTVYETPHDTSATSLQWLA